MERSELSREALRALQKDEHAEKFERIAQWLGVEQVKALVPFSREQIREALAAGDEYLNKWGNAPWDKKHGNPPGEGPGGVSLTPKRCQCCKQLLPPKDKAEGMWGLVRAAIRRDRAAGRVPLLTSWSLSDTGCTLKHVARFHLAEGGSNA